MEDELDEDTLQALALSLQEVLCLCACQRLVSLQPHVVCFREASAGHTFYMLMFCLCSGTDRVVVVIKGVMPYKPCPMQVLFALSCSFTCPFVRRKRPASVWHY